MARRRSAAGGHFVELVIFLVALDPKLLSDIEYRLLLLSLLSFSGDWEIGSGV